MSDTLQDLGAASMADKIAAINVARALFGPVAARKLWSDLGLPLVETGERKTANPSSLRDRIVKLSSNDAGMTLGVLANRCRTFGRDEVDRAAKALVSEGLLRVERFKSANGKETERFMAN